ncbi:cation:dicarboxylase symporter family transporter, partial [Salmonella enterica subsp. enterica serovar Typhimurium]|nr:cation:dicarboxylase symporter family transporter [Salmonella enterica subsp. enterica serovar Typhimurium]
VPTNLVGLEAHTKVVDGVASTSLSFNVLQLLVVAIALGIAAVKVGEKAEPFINFNRSLLEIIQKVLWWIIRLAPIGTAALIGKAVATYGFGAMGALGKFVLAVYVGLAIVLLVIYPVTLKLHGLNVAQFYRRVWPVTSLGLVTR